MLLGNPSTRSMTRLKTEYVETRSRARVGSIWQASNAKRVKHTSTKSMYNVHIAEYFAMTREFLQFLLSISLADTTLKQVKTNPQNTVVRIEWRYQAASCLEPEAHCTAEMDPRRHPWLKNPRPHKWRQTHRIVCCAWVRRRRGALVLS
jgi:hypothetical protein